MQTLFSGTAPGYTRVVEFVKRAAGKPARIAILPGTFNPPTVAHIALGRAASALVDEVVFALPRVLPHKQYVGASAEERLAMLETALRDEPRCSIAAVDGGLFLEIERECRAAYGDSVRISFLCGRDAAERIMGWDYGRMGAVDEMLSRFDLLVAARQGSYRPGPEFAAAVQPIELPCGFDEVSATEVRERIARGEPWQHLVPERIAGAVSRIYRR